MKTIIALICLALALVSCEKKQEASILTDDYKPLVLRPAEERKDIAELYLVYFQGVEIGEMKVAKLRAELENAANAGKAELLAIDLKSEIADLETTKGKMKKAYGEWLDGPSEPYLDEPMAAYETALTRARLAGDEEKFDSLRGMTLDEVLAKK